jgi:hypothetical protein
MQLDYPATRYCVHERTHRAQIEALQTDVRHMQREIGAHRFTLLVLCAVAVLALVRS